MDADRLAQAVALFNRREYLAAHEILEDVWRDQPGAERVIYEALIRVAAALHLRLHRGGGRGTLNLLQQALVLLDDLRPTCAGIDTAAFYADVARYVDELRGASDRVGWLERFRLPRIQAATAPTPSS
jgi:hypothetical protein